MLEQCDYLLRLGREAGLTCSGSPDAAIYRVNVIQGFRREKTLLKHPQSVCIVENTNNSFCVGKTAQAVTRHRLKSNRQHNRRFWELVATPDALQRGRVWQELAAGCVAAASEHGAHPAWNSEGSRREQPCSQGSLSWRFPLATEDATERNPLQTHTKDPSKDHQCCHRAVWSHSLPGWS